MFTIPELNGRMGTEKKTSTIYFYDSSSSLPAPRHLLSSKQKAPRPIPVVKKKISFSFGYFLILESNLAIGPLRFALQNDEMGD